MPGRTGRSSTRPLVSAVTLRTYIASSVPGALTSRFISPRFTVSNQSVPRSTGGAAGLRRLTATDTVTIATSPRAMPMYFLVCLGGSRLISTVTSRAEMAGGRDRRPTNRLRKDRADLDHLLTHMSSIGYMAETEALFVCCCSSVGFIVPQPNSPDGRTAHKVSDPMRQPDRQIG